MVVVLPLKSSGELVIFSCSCENMGGCFVVHFLLRWKLPESTQRDATCHRSLCGGYRQRTSRTSCRHRFRWDLRCTYVASLCVVARSFQFWAHSSSARPCLYNPSAISAHLSRSFLRCKTGAACLCKAASVSDPVSQFAHPSSVQARIRCLTSRILVPVWFCASRRILALLFRCSKA